MQIILKNGGKTSEFECEFKETEIIYYPNGKVEYELSKEDVNSMFRCCADLEYQSEYGDIDARLLNYVFYFGNDKPYLEVRNKNDNSSIRCNLVLTETEHERIGKLTSDWFRRAKKP